MLSALKSLDPDSHRDCYVFHQYLSRRMREEKVKEEWIFPVIIVTYQPNENDN